jgi:hypothetical protein
MFLINMVNRPICEANHFASSFTGIHFCLGFPRTARESRFFTFGHTLHRNGGMIFLRTGYQPLMRLHQQFLPSRNTTVSEKLSYEQHGVSVLLLRNQNPLLLLWSERLHKPFWLTRHAVLQDKLPRQHGVNPLIALVSVSQQSAARKTCICTVEGRGTARIFVIDVLD